tara:strand:- start:336 stop:485 length:150 start_codon:yes stop_codon:yes gene_type:complete
MGKTLNELRQNKGYGYKSEKVVRPSITELIKKYPNNQDLGKYIRMYYGN